MKVSSVSVLICTYNRAALLRETLDALHAMDSPDACAVEIVVVDNNSTDDTVNVVNESSATGRFPVVLVQERKQGKSFALNTGLEAATGDVLALTDDDVLPATDWLARIVQAFRSQDVTFVFGKVLPRWTSAPPPELLVPQAQDIWGPLAIVDYGDEGTRYTTENTGLRLPIGANLSFVRSVLVFIGGWRTDLGKINNTLISGEDHEIFMRMQRRGCYGGFYDPEIVVRHLVPSERLTRRYFRRWFFWHGKTKALMLADLYPELDMSAVPRLAGAPRFAYRQAIGQFLRWATTRNSDPLTALIEELRVLQFIGLFVECWRQRKRAARPLIASLLIMLATAVGAAGGPGLELRFSNGRLSLSAHGVTVQQVLREWARVGRTRVEHADAAPRGMLDLELDDVSEQEALDVLLRSAPGFITTEAAAPDQTASRFDQIVIVTASANVSLRQPTPEPAPAVMPEQTPARPSLQPATVRPVIGIDGRPVPDDQDGAPPQDNSR